MRITLSTWVAQPPAAVWPRFDASLFKALAPPFPPVRLRRFDGSLPGHEVHLELNFLLFRQEWHSLITEQQETEAEIHFVDEGTRLPFFLSGWTHRHRLVAEAGGTRIVDDISFRSPFRLLDALLYPALWLQFAYRRPIYRRLFSGA